MANNPPNLPSIAGALPQVYPYTDSSGRTISRHFESGTVAVDSSGESLGPCLVDGGSDSIITELANVGSTNPFTNVKIQAKASPNADWIDYISNSQLNAGTAVANLLDLVLTNPTTLAAAGKSLIVFRANGMFAFQFIVTSTLGTSASQFSGCKMT